ncbi:MAG: aminotransferase class I/II-fold pyridoxal phosphate-dependent enzyme [Ignavibacteriales bacterium]|nr:aminotransferase class I/II-fold pyridoxal phosphate-dependent enzyme [Ignavibacteriales bacterium]
MPYKFSESLQNLRMSPIVSISEKVKTLSPEFKARTGKDFVLFQRGEIDLPTPAFIREAAKQAMDAGYTKYPKSGGEDVYKDAILKKLSHFNKAGNLSRENIIATYGGQEALELAFKLFEGQKGVGFAPCWSVILENFGPYCSTNFVQVPLNSDFSVDYELIRKELKDAAFFYLNTPQNPSGKLFTKEEVNRIVELCKENDVFLISDESYEYITYDGRDHFSPISLDYENIISAFTLSKTYSMTGWRLGYVVTRNQSISRLFRLGDYTQTAGVTTFLQYAAAEALSNIEESTRSVDSMMKEFTQRRNALCIGLKQIPGIEFDYPHGGFYLFPSFTKLIPEKLSGTARELYIYNKLMEAGIATVYGSSFGNHFADYIRFSFSATKVPVIEEAIERIKKVFA